MAPAQLQIRELAPVLVGAIIALAGTLLAAGLSFWHGARQLKHDRAQRERERQLTLKREVYLPAAAAATKLQLLLTRSVDLTVSDADLMSDSSEASATLTKVELIGGNETITALTRFLAEFAARYADMGIARVELKIKAERIAVLNRLVDNELAKQQQYRSEIVSRGNNGAEVANLRTCLDQAIKAHAAYATEKENQTKENLDLSLALLKTAYESYAKLGELLVPTMLAVRDEMGIEYDKAEYTRCMDAATEPHLSRWWTDYPISRPERANNGIKTAISETLVGH